MNNTEKLLRAFIEASGYEIEEVMTECMPIESDITLLAKDYKVDYKVTKNKKNINYKQLLVKYIEHVTSCEGYDFINECIHDFTGDEYEELKRLVNEKTT